MSRPQDWRDELQELCEKVIEDRLSAEERDRLQQLVIEDAEARRFYVEYMNQNAALHWSAADPEVLDPNQSRTLTLESVRHARKWTRRLVYAATLLAASILFGIGIWATTRQTQEAEPGFVATLSSGKFCRWNESTLPTQTGARLTKGRLRLDSGLARITFDKGAEITLEGPADLELISPDRCVLHSGRLTANVPPPAIGFVVDTPSAVLKDWGTEFGVTVREEDKATDVQVFSGAVDVQHRHTGKTESMETGNNMRFASEKVLPFDPNAEQPVVAQPMARGQRDDRRVVDISTAMGKGKDTYVQPLWPCVNSSDVLLLVKNTPDAKSGYLRKAYIGIDLTPAQDQKIAEAQLTFTQAPSGLGFASEVPDAHFTVYGLRDEDLDGWDAAAVRWNDAPANLPGGKSLEKEKVVELGRFTCPQGVLNGTFTIAGPELAKFLNADTNGLVTFVLVRDTLGSGRSDYVHGFASRRHPYLPPPTLKLVVEPK